MEYYSAINRNKCESVELRCIDLKPVIQSEVSQRERNKYHIFTHTHTHTHSLESRKMVLMNLFAWQELRHRHRKHSRGRRVWDTLSKQLILKFICFVAVVHLLSHVQLFVTPWTTACQVLLSFTISWSLLKSISTELVMLFNHLILFCPLVFGFSCFQQQDLF